MRVIVADTSPLIMLARSDLLSVLRRVAGDIVVPEDVWSECVRDASKPGAQAIQAARAAGILDVRPSIWTGDPLPALGPGEIAAIALALELSCPALMDDRVGRRAAVAQGVTVVGSAAILVRAKEIGLLSAVRPILEDWRAAGFFLGEAFFRAVMEKAGEGLALR
jgi:predicted nucleic acid-binding protein